MPTRLGSSPDVNEISKSFRRYGQFSPIRLRKHASKEGMYEVIFGNRRLAAAKSLGWKTIVADVVEASDVDALILAFSENEDRKDFSDFEKSFLLEKLHVLSGKSYSELAEMLGKSPSYVSQHVAMLHLFPETIAPEDEIGTVMQQLTEKHARILSRIEDTRERWTTAKLVIKANMGVRELERMVANSAKRASESSKPSSHARIKEIIRAYIDGINSRDVQSCAHAMSSHFSKFSHFPPFSKLDSSTAKEHLFRTLHDLKAYEVTIESIDLRISGNTAYAIMTLRNQYGSSTRTVTGRTRLTIILEKESDDWKIVHEHCSTASPLEFLSLYTDKVMPNILT